MITKRTLDAKINEAENGAMVLMTGTVSFQKEVSTREEYSIFGNGCSIAPVRLSATYVFGSIDDASDSLAEIFEKSHKELDKLEAQVLKAANETTNITAEPKKRGRGRPRKNAN